MPDANGRFKDISVPELPWHRTKTMEKELQGLKNIAEMLHDAAAKRIREYENRDTATPSP